MTKSEPPAPKYPYVLDEAGVARVGYVAVDPAQHNKATELQLWPLFGTKLTFARPHMRAFHFQWLSFFVAFMAWFAYAPLLVIIRQDLDISTRGIWLSNVCNVAACVVARFVVGPLGDKYGAVRVQAGLLRVGRLPATRRHHHSIGIPHARHQHPRRRVALPQRHGLDHRTQSPR